MNNDCPIINECSIIAQNCKILLTDQEWVQVFLNRDKIANSPLGGAYIHKDVYYCICYLCLYDSLFEIGIDLLTVNIQNSISALKKALTLLPWPTALYCLGSAYKNVNQPERAIRIWTIALLNFDDRKSLLRNVLPETTPDYDKFIDSTSKRIDLTGALSIGFSNIEDVRNIMIESIAPCP
jgi:hypothetical protein